MRTRTVKSSESVVVTLGTEDGKELMVTLDRPAGVFPGKTITAWFTKVQAKRLRAAVDAFLGGA